MNTELSQIQHIFPNLSSDDIKSVSNGIMPTLVMRQINFKMLINGHSLGTVMDSNDIFMEAKRVAEAIRDADDDTADHRFIISTPADMAENDGFDIEDGVMIVNNAKITNSDKKSGRGRKVNPNSNIQRSYVMYCNAEDKGIRPMLAMYMNELGLSEGTARVYYHKAKKRYNGDTA